MSKWGKISYAICALSVLILIASRFIIGGWVDWLWVPFGLAIASFVTALFVDYKFYFEFLTMRTTKHGMNMGTLILMALALMVAINYFSVRFNTTIDLTEEKLHSLSEQSEKVILGLQEEVDIKVFYRGKEDQQVQQAIKGRFALYLDASNKLKYQAIDALADPVLAKEYLKSSSQATVVLEQSGRRVEVQEPWSEEKITSALIKVSRKDSKTIYFLAGHGEKDIEGTGRQALTELKKGLEGSNFKVQKLNLLQGDEMPTDISSIIAVIGPELPLLANEMDQLRKFAKAGGKLVLALDPNQKHGLASLAKNFGAEFKNNFVVSQQGLLLGLPPNALPALGVQFSESHEVTKSIKTGNSYVVALVSSEVTKAPDADNKFQVDEIVMSDPGAFHINELKRGVKQSDPRPHSMVVSVKAPDADSDYNKEFSAVIFGDSDMMSDQLIFQGLNRDLVLNSFAYLANDEGLISIRPKTPKGSQMTITRNQQIGAVAAGVSLPILLIAGSVFFYYRRKNL